MASGVEAAEDAGENRALGHLGRGATRDVAALLKGVEETREVVGVGTRGLLGREVHREAAGVGEVGIAEARAVGMNGHLGPGQHARAAGAFPLLALEAARVPPQHGAFVLCG